jgi:ubiquinone/menaquinone biosynthesis C-methylase UbiE
VSSLADKEDYYYRYLLTSEVGTRIAGIHRKYLAAYFWRIFRAYECQKVVDVGSGLGFFVANAPTGVQVVAVDANSKVVAHCLREGLMAEQGDAVSLPFADGSFDGIMCAHLLEHVTAPEEVLREFARVLVREGLLVVRVPPFDASFYDDWTHVRPYTRKSLRRLAEVSGFTVMELYSYHYDIPLANPLLHKFVNFVRHFPGIERLVDQAVRMYGLPPWEIVLIARKN